MTSHLKYKTENNNKNFNVCKEDSNVNSLTYIFFFFYAKRHLVARIRRTLWFIVLIHSRVVPHNTDIPMFLVPPLNF